MTGPGGLRCDQGRTRSEVKAGRDTEVDELDDEDGWSNYSKGTSNSQEWKTVN